MASAVKWKVERTHKGTHRREELEPWYAARAVLKERGEVITQQMLGMTVRQLRLGGRVETRDHIWVRAL